MGSFLKELGKMLLPGKYRISILIGSTPRSTTFVGQDVSLNKLIGLFGCFSFNGCLLNARGKHLPMPFTLLIENA